LEYPKLVFKISSKRSTRTSRAAGEDRLNTHVLTRLARAQGSNPLSTPGYSFTRSPRNLEPIVVEPRLEAQQERELSPTNVEFEEDQPLASTSLLTPVSEASDDSAAFKSFELSFPSLLLERPLTSMSDNEGSVGGNNVNAGGDAAGQPQTKSSWLEISDRAQQELKKDNLKRMLGTFDQDSPENLKQFLKQIEQYGKMKGWQEDESYIMLAVSQMSADTQDTLVEKLESAKGYDWEAFKTEMLDEFPEIRDDNIGSLSKLNRIQKKFQYISQNDLGFLRGYHREFTLEVNKLIDPKKTVLSNAEAVKKYLGALATKFSKSIKQRLQDELYNDPEWSKDRRRDDPYPLDQVMETAIKMSERSVGDDIYDSDGEEKGGFVSKGKKPARPSEESSTPRQRFILDREPIKKEQDPWERKISTSLDLYDVKFKEMAQHLGKSNNNMEALIKVIHDMNRRPPQPPPQDYGGYNRPPPRMDSRPTSSYNNNNSSGGLDDKSPCILCHKPGHFQRDCPEGKEMMDKGWIKMIPGTNRVVMRDDSKIPWATFGSGPTRADHVRRIAKEKGWPGTDAPANNFYFDVEEEPTEIVESYLMAPESSSSGPSMTELMAQVMVLQSELRQQKDEQSKN
jgi:hypothetical protein